MITEINVNQTLAEILSNHALSVTLQGEFIHVEHPFKAKFKATAHQSPINDLISSRLDISVVTADNETIIECFGDLGANADAALNNNFKNFAAGSLHPLLAALGQSNENISNQIDVEQWEVNSKKWTVYIGNISTKANGEIVTEVDTTTPFFNAVERAIKSQTLNNNLHWFRGYYLQHDSSIIAKEFIMDNQTMPNANEWLNDLVLMPGELYYSLRVFIVLRLLEDSNQLVTDQQAPHLKSDKGLLGRLSSWFR